MDVRRTSIALLVVTSIGCAAEAPPNPPASAEPANAALHETAETGPLGTLPASFTGDLPCASCEAIRTRLDLLDDGTFVLREEYVGEGDDATVDDIGRFTLSSDEQVLVLHGGREAPGLWRIVGTDELRKLNLGGETVDSELDYSLRRTGALDPIEPVLTMRGMYRYMADAALFEECRTGRRMPVAMEADNVALERAYLEARGEAGEPMLVSLEGRIVERPPMEGDGTVPTLIPERFIEVRPGETCGEPAARADLVGTRWVPTQLGGEPVVVPEDRKQPFLTLAEGEARAFGDAGCNRFSGSYELDGHALSFGPLAMTKMACPDPNPETAFAEALNATRSWRVLGQMLELYDESGARVARLQAHPAPDAP